MKQKKDNRILHIQGSGLVMGLSKHDDGYEFSCEMTSEKPLFLLIYDDKHNLIDRINMHEYAINDSLSSVRVTNNIPEFFTYTYELDGKPMKDAYARRSTAEKGFGEDNKSEDEYMLYDSDFDWGDDVKLNIPYSDVCAYQLHVRGFTQHYSSKVLHKGTFLGITEKVDYLKNLGINQIVLMPAYEFDEIDIIDRNGVDSVVDYKSIISRKDEPIKNINYWGFKQGQYYMPKSAYSCGNPVNEFKQMVKILHQNGIEVIMRFYFPDSVNVSTIPDILKFWMREYHVDGFFVMGKDIPVEYLSADLLLRSAKIYSEYLNKDNIVNCQYGYNHNLAVVNNEFSIVCRKFLKSDENMLQDFMFRQRNNPQNIHVVNYISNYDGFTLYDLVSYDYKHNEANNENNNDGENYNHSWNCGCEGPTRRKSVVNLRMRQIKNAFAFLILSQGVPMILAGDEMLNTQGGNNNPYCQDNETSWIVWKNTNQTKEIHDYVRKLIQLRKNHPILHLDRELKIMDYAACGFPDLSYHGDSAWAPKYDNHIRHIGIMLCGKYARIDRVTEDDFFYIAYNMFWDSRRFALPKLPKGLKWNMELCSFDGEKDAKLKLEFSDDDAYVDVCGRSVVVFKSSNIN